MVGLKRLWMGAGFLVWTAIVVIATAYWVLAGRGARVLNNLISQRAPVRVTVSNLYALNSHTWMISQRGLDQPDEIHARRQLLDDGTVRLVIDDANGFSWDTVTIDLRRDPDGTPSANASVACSRDAGPPFYGEIAGLTGDIGLNSIDWSGARPLVVSFDLHGSVFGLPDCVHGEVTVPK